MKSSSLSPSSSSSLSSLSCQIPKTKKNTPIPKKSQSFPLSSSFSLSSSSIPMKKPNPNPIAKPLSPSISAMLSVRPLRPLFISFLLHCFLTLSLSSPQCVITVELLSHWIPKLFHPNHKINIYRKHFGNIKSIFNMEKDIQNVFTQENNTIYINKNIDLPNNKISFLTDIQKKSIRIIQKYQQIYQIYIMKRSGYNQCKTCGNEYWEGRNHNGTENETDKDNKLYHQNNNNNNNNNNNHHPTSLSESQNLGKMPPPHPHFHFHSPKWRWNSDLNWDSELEKIFEHIGKCPIPIQKDEDKDKDKDREQKDNDNKNDNDNDNAKERDNKIQIGSYRGKERGNLDDNDPCDIHSLLSPHSQRIQWIEDSYQTILDRSL